MTTPGGAGSRSRRAAALVLEAPRALHGRTLLVPAVADDDAVLRVEACGLCGTDHEQFTGALPTRLAFVPGHETVGTIVSIGVEASRRWGVTAGSRVAVEVFLSCGTCDPCARGEYRHCRVHGINDMYGFIPVERPPGLWGGYAEYQYLAADSMVHLVPDGLEPVLATVFNPLGAGIRWGVTLPGTGPGDVVVVLGPGIRGLCVTAAVRDAGAAFVMVTGRGERDVGRLALAPSFGADLVVNTLTDDPVEALRNATGRLADIVVDVTAKAPEAFAQSLALVRPGGTVVVAGTRGSAATPGLWPDLIVFKEVRILGALGVDAAAYRAALELLASGRFPFAGLPRRTVSLDGAADLLAAMAGESDSPSPVHGVICP